MYSKIKELCKSRNVPSVTKAKLVADFLGISIDEMVKEWNEDMN